MPRPAAGGTFSGFHAGLGPAFSLQDRRIYSTTAFENVVFANSSATGTARLGCYESASGLVYISALNQCSIRTGVTFRNCSFRDTVGADVHRFARTDDVFSDVPLTVVDPIGECAARDAADADYVERNIADYDYGGGGEDYADAYDECAPSAIEEARNAWRAYAFGSRCRAARTFVDDDYFDCPRDVAPAHLSRPLAQLAAAKTPWKPRTYLSLRSPTLLRIQQVRGAPRARCLARRRPAAAGYPELSCVTPACPSHARHACADRVSSLPSLKLGVSRNAMTPFGAALQLAPRLHRRASRHAKRRSSRQPRATRPLASSSAPFWRPRSRWVL